MSLSVITVALNAENDLPLTIESVCHQDYGDIEYIVIDGASWDRTEELLERYRDCVDEFHSVEDAGIYYAMNMAATMVHNEYILFLNAGDYFYSNRSVSKMFERLTPGTDIFYGDHIYSHNRVDLLKRSADFSWLRKRLLYGKVDNTWQKRIPGHQATFVRASLLERLKYDTRFSICADHEFLFRAYDTGARMQYIDEIVSVYIGGGFSASSPDKVRNEWALAYRNYSLTPRAIDQFLFHGNESPYPPYHLFSGMLISNDLPNEGPYADAGFPNRFRWSMGPEIRTPSRYPIYGLQFRGVNQLPDQRVTVHSEIENLGSASLPLGPFDVTIDFAKDVAPGSTIGIRPARVERLAEKDDRYAAFAFVDFAFVTREPDSIEVSLNQGIKIAELSRTQSANLLRAGWSNVEAELGHVWSIMTNASLSVSCEEVPSEVALVLTTNAYLASGQSATLLLNSTALGTKMLLSDRITVLAFPIPTGIWRTSHANIFQLTVDKLAKAPNDDRMLGLALREMVLKADSGPLPHPGRDERPDETAGVRNPEASVPD